MARINVYAHKVDRELIGYFTQENGQGDQVENKDVLAVGTRKAPVWLDKTQLTAEELVTVKADNVARIVTPRLNSTLETFRKLTNGVKNNYVTLTDAQKDAITTHLQNAIDELNRTMWNVKDAKERNAVTL